MNVESLIGPCSVIRCHFRDVPERVQRECKRTFEAPLEHMTRTRPVTVGVRHFVYYPLLSLQRTDR